MVTAGRAGRVVHRPASVLVDGTGFVKDGHDSPGVRQHSGTLGKTDNCQIGVSLHAATDWDSAAVNWRLFLPASWDDAATEDAETAAAIRRRRQRARIGEEVRHREKWRLALDMLDDALDDWGLAARPVIADSGYGDATAFRLGPAQRGLNSLVAVKASTSAQPYEAIPVTPTWAGAGRPPQPDYPSKPTTLRELVGLARLRWRIEHDYRELKTGLGLDHFEGRSLQGWYRHVTLVSLAQAICTQLRYDPKAPAPACPCMPSSANCRPRWPSGPTPA